MLYTTIPKETNDLSHQLIGMAIKVHTALGPGLLESSYKECLYYEIAKAGYIIEKEKGLPLIYESVRLDVGYRIDLFVESRVVVEIKSVEAFSDVHTAQVLTYLKLTQCKVGLLLNFNVPDLKKGIKRLIL